MTASPRSSVNIHRSDTSRRPYLSIDRLEFSLTEGTDIPAPPQEDDIRADSPVSPIAADELEIPNTTLNTQVAASTKGPLSSHPVTPIEAPSGSDKGSFPFNRQQSSSASSATNKPTSPIAPASSSNGQPARVASPNGVLLRTATPTTSSPLSQHQNNGFRQPGQTMDPPRSADYHDQISSPASRGQETLHENQIRRPSFAQRFLRFRSLSSLRSRNSSHGSVPIQHLHNENNHFIDTSTRASAEALGHSNTMPTRGVKRPGSPSIAGLFRSAEQSSGSDRSADAGRRVSQSFPRMVRKKSMELLGSARRKSGMWSARDTMMAEAYEQERMREADMDDSDQGRKDSMATDGRQSKMSFNQQEVPREPPPTLPELEPFQEMEGESLFLNIGAESW